MFRGVCLTFGLVAVLSAGMLSAQDKPKAAITPEEAGPDFPFQGEYVGEVDQNGTRVKYGAQIIARGNGKFLGVGFPGGLPGDGFLGGEKVESEGELRNGAVHFPNDDGATVVLRDGVISITADGDRLGTLTKVERKSPTLGAKPPAGAIVLFDGTSVDQFENGRKTDDGLLMQGVTSRHKFQDATVHLEFQLSFMPTASGQARSNSGCYLQGRYEVQILDSFGLEGKHNECGGIYEIKDPLTNMCYPPLAWQTYDIDFTAAKYDAEGKKTADARMTVRHNGVLIHKDVPVPRITRAAPVAEGPEPGPLYLQYHGDPVRFRNIWIVEKK
jgi:hypothetical protein